MYLKQVAFVMCIVLQLFCTICATCNVISTVKYVLYFYIIIIIIIMFGVTSSHWSLKSRNSQHTHSKVRVLYTAFTYSSIT